ncbi:3-hydroxyacyl-CoA dehydrogenase NAD-binding domain-containing protein [Hyphomonas sp.]|uniref:3-hydroxyacyl-CoA dehydrogenase NAD-binding domain-containing protein n=1 Tax=Hyphomonas sp. TaxID=87 RepID=UPI003529A8F8
MSVVTTHLTEGVLIVRTDNPPVNALGQAVRAGLEAAISGAASDKNIEAIVLICSGRTFFAGADITEFGKPAQSPDLNDVCAVIEALNKPVIAAIHGTALGGGLEIALSCNYRVAVPSAKLGFPEVKLGLLPGSGGTQRLPRLIGVPEALTMIGLGEPVDARKALEIVLLDRIVGEDSLESDAVAFAREVALNKSHPVTSQLTHRTQRDDIDSNTYDQFLKSNARKLRGLEAPQACVEAVRAAVELPFPEGLRKEREQFIRLMNGPQSKALRHVFFAERTASRIEGIPDDTPTIPIEKVGVLGAGTMGGGIAMNFLTAGIPVTLIEREKASLDRGVATIRKNYEATASKGRLTTEQVERAMNLLTPSLQFDDLADCDLVIEAVFENMDLKLEVFARLDATIKQGAILASNTSYLSIDEMAGATARPEYVIGLHFFSPANVMKLLEVVRGAKTSATVLKTCMGLARMIGKVAAISGVCYGFIGNRMLSQRSQQAQALILEGAKPWDVDRVLTRFGFPMGPFQMSDLAGLDIGWNAKTSKSSTVREVLCERGRLGQKTGSGYYDYDENRKGHPSEETEAIIAELVAKSGRNQRSIGDEEIFERLLYPMVNEGAKILQEGIAQRASDIDVVWINGFGWPAYTGGPMYWADSIGLANIVRSLEANSVEVAPLLRAKSEAAESFIQK